MAQVLFYLFIFKKLQVQVIEEAIKYIDSLHATLYERLRAQRVIPSGEYRTKYTTGACMSGRYIKCQYYMGVWVLF